MPGPYAMGGYAMGGYAPTPAIWLPLVGAALAVGMALYCWRRRDTSRRSARSSMLSCMTFFTSLATALAAAAVDPGKPRTAWFKVGQRASCPRLTAGSASSWNTPIPAAG